MQWLLVCRIIWTICLFLSKKSCRASRQGDIEYRPLGVFRELIFLSITLCRRTLKKNFDGFKILANIDLFMQTPAILLKFVI